MTSKDLASLNHIFPPLTVYKNLHILFENRKIKLEYGSFTDKKISKEKLVSDKDFINKIQFDRFIIVSAVDAADKKRRYAPGINPDSYKLKTKTFIIIVDRGNDFTKSEHFEKMLSKLPEIKSKTRNFNIDVIIITENKISSFGLKKMDQFKFSGASDRGFVTVTPVLYTLFMYNIFDYNIVAEHKVIDKVEELEILKFLQIQKINLPKISKSDPVCTIIGGEIGDIVEIKNMNQLSGIELIYKVINR